MRRGAERAINNIKSTCIPIRQPELAKKLAKNTALIRAFVRDGHSENRSQLVYVLLEYCFLID